MKTLVLYYSKTGFTQRYAEWIAEETDADCEPFDHRDGVRFGDYDAVLFGSSVHAGSIRKLKWFKKQLPDWEGKRLGVFAVGAKMCIRDRCCAPWTARCRRTASRRWTVCSI